MAKYLATASMHENHFLAAMNWIAHAVAESASV